VNIQGTQLKHNVAQNKEKNNRCKLSFVLEKHTLHITSVQSQRRVKENEEKSLAIKTTDYKLKT